MEKIRKILICDDHAIFGLGLAKLIGDLQTITTYVSNSRECSSHLKNTYFDVLLCDINIDKENGFDLIQANSDYLQKTQIFIISAYQEDYLIQKALKMGFQGYLFKSSSSEELFHAINIEVGSPFYTPKKHKEISHTYVESNLFSPTKFLLSRQEKEIIKWVVVGLTSKEIGEKLFISKHTVDTHRRNLNKKLEIQGVSSLIKFAHENNLVD